MKFLYPNDLLIKIKTYWDNYSNKMRKYIKDLKLTCPSDENLSLMLDIMYHVSFEKEESRFIKATIGYLEPDQVSNQLYNHNNPPIKFKNPIEFNKHEIVRLSPAFNPDNSILVVSSEDLIIPNGKTNKIVIWGVIYLGNDYFNLLNGRSNGALCPPSIITLSTLEPGHLKISSGGEVFYELKSGELTYSPLSALSKGIVGEHFSQITQKLYKEVCNELNVNKYAENDSDEHPRTLYFSTLQNILRLIEQKKHGGTLIIIPENTDLDDYFCDSLNIKYKIKSPEIWNLLIKEAKNSRLYFDVFMKSNKTIDEYKQQINSENARENSKNKIYEHEEFIASLSEVDGAVVINEKFEVLGFGAELRLPSNEITYILKAEDSKGELYKEIPITSFGTRHRSAFRFCSYYKDCIIFVISQDGNVKAVKQHEGSTYLWSNVSMRP